MEEEAYGATGGCVCPNCGTKLKVVAEDEAAERRKTAVKNVSALLRGGTAPKEPGMPGTGGY
jgi:transcription initiation factor IIE alpha subunit